MGRLKSRITCPHCGETMKKNQTFNGVNLDYACFTEYCPDYGNEYGTEEIQGLSIVCGVYAGCSSIDDE